MLRWFLVGSALCILLALSIEGRFSYKRHKTRRAFQEYRQALRSKGERLTIEEVFASLPTNLPPALPTNATRLAESIRIPNIPPPYFGGPLTRNGRAAVLWKQPGSPWEIEISNPNPRMASGMSDRPEAWRIADAIQSDNGALRFGQLTNEVQTLRELLASSSIPPGRSIAPTPERAAHAGPGTSGWFENSIAPLIVSGTIAELREGQLAQVFDDVCRLLDLIPRLSRSARSPWVSFPVRLLLDVRLLTWQLLQSNELTDAQLTQLQQKWNAINFFEIAIANLEWRRALGLRELETLLMSVERSGFAKSFPRQTHFSAVVSMPRSVADLTSAFSRTFANGRLWCAESRDRVRWQRYGCYEEALSYLQLMQNAIEIARSLPFEESPQSRLDAYSVSTSLIATQDSRIVFTGLKAELELPLATFNGALLLKQHGAANSFLSWTLMWRTQQTLATTAIAVERFQLKSGMPPNLATLVPEYLPNIPTDAFRHAPLIFTTNTDHTYQIAAGPWPRIAQLDPAEFAFNSTIIWPAPMPLRRNLLSIQSTIPETDSIDRSGKTLMQKIDQPGTERPGPRPAPNLANPVPSGNSLLQVLK